MDRLEIVFGTGHFGEHYEENREREMFSIMFKINFLNFL